MRATASAFCLSLCATGLQADEWGVQYLSFSGGTHAVQEVQGEHQFAEAYFRNDAGVGVRIGCAQFGGDVQNTIQFSVRGEPVFGRSIEGAIVLGNAISLDVGEMPYERGGYHGFLSDRHIAYLHDAQMLDMAFDFEWSSDDGVNQARFDMVTTGLSGALAGIECMYE